MTQSPWNIIALGKLCLEKNDEEAKRFINEINSIETTMMNNENDERAINLIQSAIKMRQQSLAMLKAVTTKAFYTIADAVEKGQRYFDSTKSARENVQLSLRRIKFVGDSDYIINLVIDDENIDFFMKFLCDQCYEDVDRCSLLTTLTNGHNNDIRREFIDYYYSDGKARFIFNIRGDDGISSEAIVSYIENVKKDFPLDHGSSGFRMPILREKISRIVKTLKMPSAMPVSIENDNTGTILSKLPDFTEDEENSLYINVSANHKIVIDYIKELLLLERKRKAMDAANIVTYKNPMDMTLDEVCHFVGDDQVWVMYFASDWIDAFSIQTQILLNSGAPIHSILSDFTRLIQSFSHAILKGFAVIRNVFYIEQYNALLNVYLIGIDDINHLCSCCETVYSNFIVKMDGIEKLIQLSEENLMLLKDLRVTIKLPLLEEIWGLDEKINSEKEISYEDDDEIELNHFYDDEEEVVCI